MGGDATFSFDLSASGLPSADPNGNVAAFGYLNVMTTTGDWLVHDQPIPLSGVAATEQNNVWFTDFANIVGGSPLDVSAIVNNTPYLSQPTPDGTWTTQAVTPGSFNWAPIGYTGQTGSPIPASAPTAPPPPPDAAKIEGYLRGGVADIKQLWNECGPTSTADSLIWLANKYGFANKLPTNPDGSINQQALVLQLAQAMVPGYQPNYTLPNVTLKDGSVYQNQGYPGLNDNQLVTGKQTFITAKNLPLVVEGGNNDPNASGANTFTFIQNELNKGQDVEFLIAWPNDGYHWVTVDGYINAGVNNKTLIVHDPLLANGNNYWQINDNGVLSSPVGTAAWAVAESIPEPASIALLASGFLGFAVSLRKSKQA